MWYVTVTNDTWREVNILSKCQVPSSYRLEMKVSWRFGGRELLNEWMNEWINVRCVYRTAPATPVLVVYAFFQHPGLVYWDLTRPMFVTSASNIGHDTSSAERNHSVLVLDDKRMKMFGKALRVSCWIKSLGKSQGQNRWGLRPLEF